jgi:hypothetical protein
MIKIFSDFFPIFGPKNWRFSWKPMLLWNLLYKLAIFWVKNAKFFRQKYSKNHNIGPGWTETLERKTVWEALYWFAAISNFEAI